MLRVCVEGGVVEGTLFAVDPVTLSIVLRDEKNDTFTLLNYAQIQSIDGNLDLHNLPDLSLCGPNLNSLEKYEIKACDLAEKSISALNFNVTPEIQTLFDRLNFIWNCQWSGASIIILNEYIIDPPYDSVQKLNRANTETAVNSGMDRIVKVLEGERKKLKL